MNKLILAIVIILSGCGSDDKDKKAAPTIIVPEEAVGTVIDSPVEGLTYKSISYRGVTDVTGEFKYKPSEETSFYLGTLLIGKVIGNVIVTPQMLMGQGNARSPAVLNFSRFIQTLDDDSNPKNGIKISTDTASAVSNFTSNGLDFNLSISAFEQQTAIQNILQHIDKTELVSDEDAYIHLMGSLYLSRNHTNIYAFNSSYEMDEGARFNGSTNSYLKQVDYYINEDMDEPIAESKPVYFNNFPLQSRAYVEPDYSLRGRTLSPFYEVEYEGSTNTNPTDIKITKAWATLEGVAAKDPTLSFQIAFDTHTDIFFQDDHYYTVGIEFRINDDVYEVEAGLSDGFLNFAKNNNDIYGNIRTSNDYPSLWIGNSLNVNLPVSIFELTKSALFGVSNHMELTLYYRDINSGNRIWNSSYPSIIKFDEPVYYSPSTVQITLNTDPSSPFKFSNTEVSSDQICYGIEFEHWAFFDLTYNLSKESSIEDTAELDGTSIYTVDFSSRIPQHLTLNQNGQGECVMSWWFSFAPEGDFYIQLASSELQLTSHDVVRLFSSVDMLYGGSQLNSGLHYLTSNIDAEYPSLFLYHNENSVSEKLDGDVPWTLWGGKMRCPYSNCDVDYKPWYGTISLEP